MISLRRHVLTLVAVFLALAMGVVLGSTSVATSIRDAAADRRETTAARLETAEAHLDQARLAQERLDGLAGSLTPESVAGVLRDRPVLVVVAPGAVDEDVRAVADLVDRAGGVAAGRIQITDKAVDPAADAELLALVDNLPIGTAPAADADLGTQLGTALGRAALLRTEDAEPHLPDGARATVLTTLADAGMIEYEAGTIRPGQVTLVVTGPVGSDETAARLASMARTLDREGGGAVVTADLGGDDAPDTVTLLRDEKDGAVSTVDSCGTAAGRLAVVLALAEQVARGQGHYGLRADATSAVPDVTPSTREPSTREPSTGEPQR